MENINTSGDLRKITQIKINYYTLLKIGGIMMDYLVRKNILLLLVF